METRFISDLHFGHKNVLAFDNRPFSSIDKMDEYIISHWNSTVRTEDQTYILGDVSWYNSSKTQEILNSLNGDKILICGNHDKQGGWYECFKEVLPYQEIKIDGHTIVLCHYPIHFFNKHYYGAYMLYGHVHNSHEHQMTEYWKRAIEELDIPCNMFNVGCMIPYMDYTPRTLKEIIIGASKNV